MKKIVFSIFAVVFSMPAMALTVSGTVLDNDEQLFGATIYEPKSQQGTITNSEGRFSWEIDVDPDTELEVSFTGCSLQKFKASELNDKRIDLNCREWIDEIAGDAEFESRDCKLDELNAVNATAGKTARKDGEDGIFCNPSACKDGFRLNDSDPEYNTCDEDLTLENNDDTEEIDEEPEEEVIDEEPEDDLAGAGLNPVTPRLSQQESEQKVSELRDNYNAVKANEQSLENRTLGAAAMATVGAGGQMTASSLSEQKSDADAERDMAAYLATFRCDWGAGRNVRGGETNVELPGAGQLIPLYSEYVTLANDLKLRKAQLGLKAGIESEPILDSATTGLYDDVSTGISSGAYASLARALQNPNGADAKMWAEQKEKTAQNLKTGVGLVATGVAASVAGNAIINRDAPRDRSREIIAEFESLFSSLEEDVASLSPQPCSGIGVSGGTYPKCTCKNDNERYSEKNGCQPCPPGRQYNDDNECVPDAQGVGASVEDDCHLTGAVKKGICQCADNAVEVGNQCTCKANFYEYTDRYWGTKSCICLKLPEDKVNPETCTCKPNYVENGVFCDECLSHQTYQDGKCVDIIDAPTTQPEDIIQSVSEEKVPEIKLPSDKLFKPGKDEFNDEKEARERLAKFAHEFNSKKGKLGTEYCILVTGHTDRTGWRDCAGDCSVKRNRTLSENRARAVAYVLKDNGINQENICASGMGQVDCDTKKYPEADDENCRRVEFSLDDKKECPKGCLNLD